MMGGFFWSSWKYSANNTSQKLFLVFCVKRKQKINEIYRMHFLDFLVFAFVLFFWSAELLPSLNSSWWKHFEITVSVPPSLKLQLPDFLSEMSWRQFDRKSPILLPSKSSKIILHWRVCSVIVLGAAWRMAWQRASTLFRIRCAHWKGATARCSIANLLTLQEPVPGHCCK